MSGLTNISGKVAHAWNLILSQSPLKEKPKWVDSHPQSAILVRPPAEKLTLQSGDPNPWTRSSRHGTTGHPPPVPLGCLTKQ